MLRKNDEICLPGGVRGIRCGALSCLVLGTRAGSALFLCCIAGYPTFGTGQLFPECRKPAARARCCSETEPVPELPAVPWPRAAPLRRHGSEMGGSGITLVALELVMLKLLVLTAQAGR